MWIKFNLFIASGSDIKICNVLSNCRFLLWSTLNFFSSYLRHNFPGCQNISYHNNYRYVYLAWGLWNFADDILFRKFSSPVWSVWMKCFIMIPSCLFIIVSCRPMIFVFASATISFPLPGNPFNSLFSFFAKSSEILKNGLNLQAKHAASGDAKRTQYIYSTQRLSQRQLSNYHRK